MVSKPIDLLFCPVAVNLFHTLQYLCVQHAPALREERVVRNLVCQRMLERILHFRKQARLVEKFNRFEMGDSVLQRFFRHIDDSSQQRERHRLADDGCDLQNVLFSGRQAIDASSQDRLHAGRHFDAR